jgi:hypothetical protein
MYLLMIIGLVVCAIGKLKLTPTITLEGVRARWYGLALFITAIPYYWLARYLFLMLLPSQVLHDQLFMSVIAIVTVIGYVVLLALPFRERKQ